MFKSPREGAHPEVSQNMKRREEMVRARVHRQPQTPITVPDRWRIDCEILRVFVWRPPPPSYTPTSCEPESHLLFCEVCRPSRQTVGGMTEHFKELILTWSWKLTDFTLGFVLSFGACCRPAGVATSTSVSNASVVSLWWMRSLV